MIKRVFITLNPSVTYIVKVRPGETVQVIDRDSNRVLKEIRYSDMKSDIEKVMVG
jgi:hypothetical protein